MVHSLGGQAVLRRLLMRCCAVAPLANLCGSRTAQAAASLCGSAPPPPCPPPESPPRVQSWLLGGHQDGPLPDCAALRGRDFELLVRLTGSYTAAGDLDGQLARFGAISALKGATYWSFSNQQRLALFREAFAVDHAGSVKPRRDYSAAELRSGAELPFVESDNRSSTLMPHSLQLVHSTPASFVLRIENLSDHRFMGLTLMAAREVQWSVAVEQLGAGRWAYRSLLGQRRLHLGRAEQHRLSNLSRCVALFDLVAGRQTDIEGFR